MSLDLVERVVQWAGAAALAVFLALVFLGMARALRRPRGRATGLADKALRGPVYLLIGVPFFAVAFLLWRPLPLALSPSLQALALALGALLYFPGLGLALWGRLVLGEMYNVSMASASSSAPATGWSPPGRTPSSAIRCMLASS